MSEDLRNKIEFNQLKNRKFCHERPSGYPDFDMYESLCNSPGYSADLKDIQRVAGMFLKS